MRTISRLFGALGFLLLLFLTYQNCSSPEQFFNAGTFEVNGEPYEGYRPPDEPGGLTPISGSYDSGPPAPIHEQVQEVSVAEITPEENSQASYIKSCTPKAPGVINGFYLVLNGGNYYLLVDYTSENGGGEKATLWSREYLVVSRSLDWTLRPGVVLTRLSLDDFSAVVETKTEDLLFSCENF